MPHHRKRDRLELVERLEPVLATAHADRAQQLTAILTGQRAEDVADVLTRFASEDKLLIFAAIPEDEQRAWVLAETDPTSRQELVELLPKPMLVETVEQMDPDDATDLLEELDDVQQAEVITQLEPDMAREVRDLLKHAPESAGGIMTSEFVAVRSDQSAGEVLGVLQRTLDTEVVSYVYVVDADDRLQGVISIREIIAAAPEDRVVDRMKTELITAHVDDDQEEVAHLARKYNLQSIPVLDDSQHLLGVATVDDILDIISEEADEDIYRLAGSPGHHPSQQRILRRVLARIPWLGISLLAGVSIGYLQKKQGEAHATGDLGLFSVLLVFTPLVIGIAGGVGTQSSTLIARGLATGEVELSRYLRILFQEFVIGATISLVMGVLVMGLLYAMSSTGVLPLDAKVPVAVGIGLIAGVLLAAVSGTSIPLVCETMGVDPALVAGPFITSFNDVVGALAYLAIAKAILGI